MSLHTRVFCEAGIEDEFIGEPPARPLARSTYRAMGRLASTKPAFTQHADPKVAKAVNAHGERYKAHLERQIVGRRNKGVNTAGRERDLNLFNADRARARIAPPT